VQVAIYLYKRGSAAAAMVGNLIKRWSAPAENSIVKKHVRGGKCRNTDRRPNKNVNSPFLSLLKRDACFSLFKKLEKRFNLADLEKMLRSAAGIQIHQEKCSLSFRPMLFQ